MYEVHRKKRRQLRHKIRRSWRQCLLRAIREARKEEVLALLGEGLDPSFDNELPLSLVFCCMEGEDRAKVLLALLDAGADKTNPGSKTGQLAASYRIFRYDANLIPLLRKYFRKREYKTEQKFFRSAYRALMCPVDRMEFAAKWRRYYG